MPCECQTSISPPVSACYCNEDQGAGYTFSDEHGPCLFCSGDFEEGATVYFDKYNEPHKCTCAEEV